MAEDDYLKQIYQGKRQMSRNVDREPKIPTESHDAILDQYASLRKNRNPRANAFYSMHREHLDGVIEKLSEEAKRLEDSLSSGDRKKAKKIRQKYGHLL